MPAKQIVARMVECALHCPDHVRSTNASAPHASLADSVKTVSRSLLFHEFKDIIRQSHSPIGMTYISEDKVAVYLAWILKGFDGFWGRKTQIMNFLEQIFVSLTNTKCQAPYK